MRDKIKRKGMREKIMKERKLMKENAIKRMEKREANERESTKRRKVVRENVGWERSEHWENGMGKKVDKKNRRERKWDKRKGKRKKIN